jgi:hypothetical protein
MAAVEDADTYSCAGDGVLAAVWQSVSDRYPDPVRLDADRGSGWHRTRRELGYPPTPADERE